MISSIGFSLLSDQFWQPASIRSSKRWLSWSATSIEFISEIQLVGSQTFDYIRGVMIFCVDSKLLVSEYSFVFYWFSLTAKSKQESSIACTIEYSGELGSSIQFYLAIRLISFSSLTSVKAPNSICWDRGVKPAFDSSSGLMLLASVLDGGRLICQIDLLSSCSTF